MLAYAERRQAEMVRSFERVGSFEVHGQSYCATLFATHELVPPRSGRAVSSDDWKTGGKLAAPKAVDVFLPELARILALDPVQQKDAFAFLIKEYAKKVKAIGLLFMSEIWWAQMTGTTHEEVEVERAKRPASLENWDDRREGLFMQLEHPATGKRVWFNEIKRHPTRLEGWENKNMDDSEGRFVGLVGWQS